MIIREETPADIAAIDHVTTRAFAGTAYSDGSEPRILMGLRASGALSLSLVAEKAGAIIGHVALSPVAIDGVQNWFGLGPISVHPDHQGQGIGIALMQAALQYLASTGGHGCVLVGDPSYYGRFGFASGPVSYPGVPRKAVMYLTIAGDDPSGELRYHSAFGGA